MALSIKELADKHNVSLNAMKSRLKRFNLEPDGVRKNKAGVWSKTYSDDRIAMFEFELQGRPFNKWKGKRQ